MAKNRNTINVELLLATHLAVRYTATASGKRDGVKADRGSGYAASEK